MPSLRRARHLVAVLLLALSPLAGSVAARAQERLPQTLVAVQGERRESVPAGLEGANADEKRNQFRELMRQYPPALSRVLRLDTSLLRNDTYLAAYPALVTFLAAHPEIPRYPEYFLDFASGDDGGAILDAQSQLRREAIRAQQHQFENLAVLGMISVVAVGVIWLVRLFVGHRRWIRVTRLQAEMNNRLVERMGNTEELLSYFQAQGSPQLTAAPLVGDGALTSMGGAPFARILWAVQAGLVLVCGGVGLLIVRNYVYAETGEVLLTLGVLAVSIGVGCAAASVASYVLSRRFGLIDDARGGNSDPGRA